MSFIPIIVEPYPDELLYSWILRLAKANGLSPLRFFEGYFGFSCLRKGAMPLDIRDGYRNFYKALNSNLNEMQLYFKLTTMQFELSFCTPEKQLQILNNVLRRPGELNIVSKYYFSKPKICLQCMKEDMEEYGEAYFHRCHQLSGVTTCYKHSTPLYELDRMKGARYEFDWQASRKIKDEITDFDVAYAKYAYELLNINFSSNYNDIFSLITKTLNVQNFGKNRYSRQNLVDNILKLLPNLSNVKRLQQANIVLSVQNTINILMQLFPDVHDFINALPSYEMITTEYCDVCNEDYCTTPKAKQNGWGCPVCDDRLNDRTLANRLVNSIGNGEYQLKDIVPGKVKKAVVHHKKCGKTYSVGLKTFIYDNPRCECMLTLQPENAKEKMLQYEDFELIEFKALTKPAKLKHKVCGNIFEVRQFLHFIKVPMCRCCEMTQVATTESFKKEVEDLVGDEYEIIGEVFTKEEPVKMRHNVCGKEHMYNPWHFTLGSRCPHCTSLVNADILNKMFDDYTDGRYQIVEKLSRYKNVVLDTVTNNTMEMSNELIVQELLRPTPSSYFVVDLKKNRVKRTSWDDWYDLCIEYKNEFGHINPCNKVTYKGKGIAAWCCKQRSEYKKNELSDDKIQLLKAIGFEFDINNNLTTWKRNFEIYKEFVTETKTIYPKQGTIYQGLNIYDWVHHQRAYRNQGTLNKECEHLLLEFNPTFFGPIRRKR